MSLNNLKTDTGLTIGFGVMVDLRLATTEIHPGGEQINSSVSEFSKLAEQLKSIMGRFKV